MLRKLMTIVFTASIVAFAAIAITVATPGMALANQCGGGDGGGDGGNGGPDIGHVPPPLLGPDWEPDGRGFGGFGPNAVDPPGNVIYFHPDGTASFVPLTPEEERLSAEQQMAEWEEQMDAAADWAQVQMQWWAEDMDAAAAFAQSGAHPLGSISPAQ